MIARLKQRIGIYRPQTQPDALGGAVTSWPFWASAWADVRAQTTQQDFSHGRAAVTVRYRVVIRFKESFPERARLMWGAKTLRVLTASDPDGRRERLHLICEEEQQ